MKYAVMKYQSITSRVNDLRTELKRFNRGKGKIVVKTVVSSVQDRLVVLESKDRQLLIIALSYLQRHGYFTGPTEKDIFEVE